MLISGVGFEQAYNAQAAVDDQTMLVVTTGVSQVSNDKEQVIPMLEILQAQTGPLGPIEALGITPFIAVAREAHYPDWR